MKKLFIIVIAFVTFFSAGNAFTADKKVEQKSGQSEVTKPVYAFRSLKDGSTFYSLSDEKMEGFEFKGRAFYIIIEDLVYASDKDVSSKDNR